MNVKTKNNVSRSITVFLLALVIYFLGNGTSVYSRRTDYINQTILKIEVSGNKNTDSRDIIDSLYMKVGDVLTEEMINRDIKTLFLTGNYYNIDIQAEKLGKGIKIIVVLQERPKVKEIEFIGADEVFPSELRDKIPLKEGEVITPTKVEDSKDLIIKKYREEGFFLAYVQTILGKVDPETNLLKVKFIIDEGENIPVAKINFYGNETVNSSDILDILESKEEGTFESGQFNEASFEGDKQKILGIMKSQGFIDAEIIDASWEIKWKNPSIKDKRVIIINYKVQEGERYFFNGYALHHDKTIDTDGSPMFLNKEGNPPGTSPDRLKPIYSVDFLSNMVEYSDRDIGDVFNEVKFFNDRNIINESYSQKGYLFAQVIPDRTIIRLNEKELDKYSCNNLTGAALEECQATYKNFHIDKLKKILRDKPELTNANFVHTDISIRENHLAYIENVIIKGNKKTLEKVIRRELLFKPGSLYNSTLVNRSREKIYNLGYFKEVNFNMRPGSDESKMNLIVEVVEQPTGTVSMGGGYGTLSGFSIFTEVGERNLNGTGQKLSGRLEYGPIRRYFELTWTEPWLLDKPYALSISAFFSTIKRSAGAVQITENNNQSIQEAATYVRNDFGMSVGIGHRFWINWQHFHRYTPSFFSSSQPSSLASNQILAETAKGWQFKSSLTNGISYDIRDNVFSPTSGFRTTFSMENVGQYLGGNSHYDRFNPLIEYYHTWFDYTFGGLFRKHSLRRWRVVQEFRFSGSFTYERSPIAKKDDSLRKLLNPDYDPRIQNPYIQSLDYLYLGGYESLRGWNYQDNHYPYEWADGASHRMIVGTELRFPIEPSMLWLVTFFDGGALYEEVNRFYGDRLEAANTYKKAVSQLKIQNPYQYYLNSNYNSYGQRIKENPYDLNDPSHLVLSSTNVSLERFRFSWGFGLRIQIPVLPLRLYFAQKLRYTGDPSHPFGTYVDDHKFQFVFGIGDIRF